MADDEQAPDKEAKSVSIRFPVTILERVRAAAKREARSLNSEVVWIVRQYVEQQQQQQEERDNGAND